LRVVDALRERGSASRADLARITGLSRTTITSVVRELQANGLIVERPDTAGLARRAETGRPPVLLGLNAAAGAAVGVAFDHRRVRVALADLSATVLAERETQLDVDHDAISALDTAAELVEQLVADSPFGVQRLIGAGMGLPGPIDLESGTVGSSVMLPGWIGYQPSAELSTRLGLHVAVDNDANLAALGELLFGAARGVTNGLYVKVSSGIGAGLVLGGWLYRGSMGRAGELGHVRARPDGIVCRCGNRGCLETVASIPALCELLRPVHGRIAIEDVLDLLRTGDVATKRVVDEAGRAIGRVLADLCAVLDLETIVVGGELAAAGDLLLRAVEESIERHALPAAAESVDVRPALLGDRAEVLGALALVIGDTDRLRSAELVAIQEPADGRSHAHLTRVSTPQAVPGQH
jgi:predicted NBD/HSP70 family sugar kinase